MESNITETVLKNRRYNELMSHLFQSLPAADERMKSCISGASSDEGICHLDPSSQLEALNGLCGEVQHMQHDVDEFLSCSKDLIAILSVLDCHDTPKAHEIHRCMNEIQQLCDKTTSTVQQTQTELSQKIEKQKTVEQEMDTFLQWLKRSENRVQEIVQVQLTESVLLGHLSDQREFESAVVKEKDHYYHMVNKCKMLDIPAQCYENLDDRFSALLSSIRCHLQRLELIQQKVDYVNHIASSLDAWLSELIVTLDCDTALDETVAERQSRADNICNQRHMKRKAFDEMNQIIKQLSVDGFVLEGSRLYKVIENVAESWSQMSHSFRKFVSSLLLADLDQLIPSLDQNPANLTNTDVLVDELDIHDLASYLQIQKDTCHSFDETCRSVHSTVAKYQHLLNEAYDDTTSLDCIELHNRLMDAHHRSQLANQHASRWLSSLNDIWPIACHIKKRKAHIECWLRDIEAEITMLDDIPTHKDLEQIGVYRQSVCAMERLITDYQSIVDDLVVAANEFYLMDIVGDKTTPKIGVDGIVEKFDAVKNVVSSHRTTLDILCTSAIEEHVAMLHNAAQQLHSRLTFADPVLKDSVSISKQIAHNESLIDELKSLSSAVTAFSATFSQLDKTGVSAADQSVGDEDVKAKLTAIIELRGCIENAVQTRAEQLLSALAEADQSEVVLRNASERVSRVKDYVTTSTVDSFDCVSMKQHLEKLKENFDEMVETRQSVRNWSSCGVDGTTIDLSVSESLPTGEQVAFEVRYEEVMDLLKESMHDHESQLASLLEYENLHQSICNWMSSAEHRIVGLTTVADSIRTVRIQIEELKIFNVQLRTWHVELQRWNQVAVVLCTIGRPLENASLNLLKARVADINGRWMKLSSAVERREVDLMTAYVKLGEVDAALEDINGLIQGAESDLADYRQAYGDPLCIRLEITKIDKLVKEVARQRTALGMLVNTVKSVHPIANSNVVSHSTAFDKKLSETEELLSELEVNARETQAMLRSRLQQVQSFLDSATSLTRWFTESKRLVVARNAVPFGALVESAQRQLNEARVFLSTVDEKHLEVRAILLSGEDLVSRCQASDAKMTTDVLDRLREVSVDFKQKADRYKTRLEVHVKNVELFHRLMQGQVDWLSDAETRLFTLRRPSRLADKAQEQLGAHQLLMDEIAMHREPMKHVDLTGTYLKYLGTRFDFYQLGELLMMLRLRWKRLVRNVTETGQQLLNAFYQNKRFAEGWSSLCNWLEETERQLQYQSLCAASSRDISDLHRIEVELSNRLPSYLSTRRNGMMLYERCSKVGDGASEKQTIMTMLVTMTKHWNSVRSLVTKSGCRDISVLLSLGRSSDAMDALIRWIDRAKLYLARDQPVLGDLDTVTQLIDQHQNFQKEAVMKRELIEKMLEVYHKEVSLDPRLETVATDWTMMIKLEADRWTDLQQALRLANSLNESMDAVLEWLPRAEDELSFRQIPNSEDEILKLIESHSRFHDELHGQTVFVDELMHVGNEITSSCHSNAKRTVSHHLASISARWQQVLRRSSFRGQRLKETLDSVRNSAAQISSFSQWISDVKAELQSEEYSEFPQNVSDLKQLIKQHKTFLEKLSGRRAEVDWIKQLVEPIYDTSISSSTGSDQSKPCKANEVVDMWQSVWRMSCTRTMKLEEALRELKRLDNRKCQKTSDKTRPLKSMIDTHSNGDRSVRINHQPSSSLKLDSKMPGGVKNSTIPNSAPIVKRKSTPTDSASLMGPQGRSRKHSKEELNPQSMLSEHKHDAKKTSNISGTGLVVSGRPARDSSRSSSTRSISSNHSDSDLATSIDAGTSAQTRRSSRSEGTSKNMTIGFIPIPEKDASNSTSVRSIGGKEKRPSQVNKCADAPRKSKSRGVPDVSNKVADGRRCISSCGEIDRDVKSVHAHTDNCVTRRSFGGYTSVSEGQTMVHSSSACFHTSSSAPHHTFQDSRPCCCRNEKPTVSAESISEMIREELMRCQCPEGFIFEKIDDGKYKFGSRSRMCLVRFVNSTVTVRVGGGWLRLEEFLNAFDPCRVRHRRRLLPSAPDDVFEPSTDSPIARNPSPARSHAQNTSPLQYPSGMTSSSSSLTPPSTRRSERGSREPISERGRDPVRQTRKANQQSSSTVVIQRATRSLSRLAITSKQPVATAVESKPKAGSHTRRIPRSFSQTGSRIPLNSIN